MEANMATNINKTDGKDRPIVGEKMCDAWVL
jgi:hypothetical protein